jgi:chorismate synthase
MESDLAHAMLGIPATKSFDIGSGFGGCDVPRSMNNDPFMHACP